MSQSLFEKELEYSLVEKHTFTHVKSIKNLDILFYHFPFLLLPITFASIFQPKIDQNCPKDEVPNRP